MSSQSPAGPPPETPSAPTHEIGQGFAPSRETTTPGTPSPRPEMMLGLALVQAAEAGHIRRQVGF